MGVDRPHMLPTWGKPDVFSASVDTKPGGFTARGGHCELVLMHFPK